MLCHNKKNKCSLWPAFTNKGITKCPGGHVKPYLTHKQTLWHWLMCCACNRPLKPKTETDADDFRLQVQSTLVGCVSGWDMKGYDKMPTTDELVMRTGWLSTTLPRFCCPCPNLTCCWPQIQNMHMLYEFTKVSKLSHCLLCFTQLEKWGGDWLSSFIL